MPGAVALGPTIETARLTLRPPVAADLDGWAEFMADEAATRLIGGVVSRAEAWRNMAASAGSWALQGFGMFSVIERGTGPDGGRWIGRIGPLRPEGWPGTEVGWGLLPSAWGRGFAVEAATASIDWAFDVLDWTDVIHVISPQNTASMEVARRLGAVNRGPGRLPEPLADKQVNLWGQTRAMWRARSGRR